MGCKRTILCFILMILVVSVRLGDSCIAGSQTDPNYFVYLYYDARYPRSWLSPDDSWYLKEYISHRLNLYNVSYRIVNAEDLAKVMINLTAASQSIVVMTQDIAPDTIWNGSQNSTVGQWLRTGGSLLWTGDYEFYFIGYSNGAKRDAPGAESLVVGQPITVGVDVDMSATELGRKVLPSFEKPIRSLRPVNSSLLAGLSFEAYGQYQDLLDPVLINVGLGYLGKVIMSGSGHVNVLTRALLLSELILNRFFKLGVNLSERRGPRERLVLAYYYSWYGRRDVSGRWTRWEGSGHDPGLWLTENKRDIASAFYPAVGLYDSSEESTLKSHIWLAKSAGIDAFIVNYYLPHEDQNFRRLLQIANQLNFKVTAQLEPEIAFHPWSKPYNRSEAQAFMENLFLQILENYADEPSFLKINNRPVIAIRGAEWTFKPEEWDEIISKVKSLGHSPLIAGDIYTSRYLQPFDILVPWLMLDVNGSNARTHLSNLYLQYDELLGLYPEKRYWAVVWPGFNDTGVSGWGGGRVQTREHGQLYNETWSAALDSNADSVAIATWNNWNEGTQIEPSLEHGDIYLNYTSTFVSYFKAVTLREAKLIPELVISKETYSRELYVNDVLCVEVNIKNMGNSTVSNLTITEGVSDAFNVLGSWGLIQRLERLLPGRSIKYTILYRVTDVGNLEVPCVNVSFLDVYANKHVVESKRIFVESRARIITDGSIVATYLLFLATVATIILILRRKQIRKSKLY